MQHHHLLRELRIAPLCLGLSVDSNSDSPSGEEGRVETVVIVVFFFCRPQGRDTVLLGSPRQLKEAACRAASFAEVTGKLTQTCFGSVSICLPNFSRQFPSR